MNHAQQFTNVYTSGVRAWDVVANLEKVFWYPYWGAFYWVSYGYL